jgi:hypothetical protein
MNEQNWLMQSLDDATRRAEELPRWARDVNSAVDDFYHRDSRQLSEDREDRPSLAKEIRDDR